MQVFERETIIRFDEGSNKSMIYTSSKRVADKLIKAGLVPLKTTMCRKEITGWYFELESHKVIVKPSRTSIRLGIKAK